MATIAATSLVVAMSMVSAASATAAVRPSDVPASSQFVTEIVWLIDEGVSTGYPDGTFHPYDAVSRDAMAAFLYRLAGQPAFVPPPTSPFRDVAPTAPFYREITWLASTGISTGYPDGTFRPYSPVSRDAMAAFLYRFEGSPAVTTLPRGSYWDVPVGRQFFVEIAWLTGRGVSTGYDEGYGCSAFRPLNPVTRDAMAAFMYRLVNGGTATPPTGEGCVPAAKELLVLVNQARGSVGVASLSYDPVLVDSSCAHSTWMAQTHTFEHSTSGPWSGENIAWGYTSVASVFDAWMNSPGHRANILRPAFTRMGACESASGHYWTQQFA